MSSVFKFIDRFGHCTSDLLAVIATGSKAGRFYVWYVMYDVGPYHVVSIKVLAHELCVQRSVMSVSHV